MCLRIVRLSYCAWPIRIAYACFLLSNKKLEENLALQQRISRGGFSSERELFEHYAEISGCSYGEVQKYFGREKGWKSILGRSYYSGGHALFEQAQKMHVGMVANPNQELKTLSINAEGLRQTSYDSSVDLNDKECKTCLLLGGSASFGLGATADEHTIAGRLGYYLNNDSNIKTQFCTLNAGALGFNSLQELFMLIQSSKKFDYIVTLSGWNEVDQALSSQSKVAAMAQACDSRVNGSFIKRMIRLFFKKIVFLGSIVRFIKAFCAYDSFLEEKRDSDVLNIYTLF